MLFSFDTFLILLRVFDDISKALFLCKNKSKGGNLMLFNLWNIHPHYLSASDGVFIEEALKEDIENGISEPVFPTIPTTTIPATSTAANG